MSTVLEKNAEGKDVAKQGLTDEQRKKLRDLDEGIFICEGEHMVANYEELYGQGEREKP